MHKILVVGHTSSNTNKVVELLHSFGMQEAKPSRREGFTPLEITKTICQAHGVEDQPRFEIEPDFSQLEVGNVWHGMALDLMLGNLDSKIWGWADANSIYLLNYWRDLDPEITFVLVYSNPEDVLLNNQLSGSLSASDLDAHIQHWVAYNEALLHFYHRNKERCFLVHSQQVATSAHRYLLEIGTKINAPWLEQVSSYALEDESQAQNVADIENEWEHQVDSSEVMHNEAIATKTKLVQDILPFKSSSEEKPLSLFLSKLIIQQHPKLVQVYEDLQSFANFPLNVNSSAVQQQHFNQSAFDAWLEMNSYIQKAEQLQQVQNQLEQAHLENNALEAEAKKLEVLPELEKKSALLVSQLQQVQDQLEQAHLQNKTLKASETANQAKALALDEAQARIKALQAEAKKLEVLPELEQENALLLSQLHHVQEELERYYLENKAYKEVANANPQELGYTAEQIKRQLPFRLGKLMIAKHQSFFGMLFISVALIKEARACKKEALASPQQKKKLTSYERNQVESIKKYLDYRLGVIFLDSLKNPLKWFTMPFKFWHEIKPYLQK